MILIDNEKDIISLTQDNDVAILDVRTEEEYNEGHLDNAINVDVLGKNFKENISKFDRDKIYFVHCAVGMRSKKASGIMEKLNFKYINNSKFGYDEIIKIIHSGGK